MNKTTENIQIDLFKRADDLTSSINNAIAALQKADGAKAKVEIEAEIKGQKDISKLQEELNELVNKKNELELQIKVDTDKVAKVNIEKLIKPLESEIDKINQKLTSNIDAMIIKGLNAFDDLDVGEMAQGIIGVSSKIFDSQIEDITKLIKKIAELNQYYKTIGKNLPTKYEDIFLDFAGNRATGEHFKDFKNIISSGKEVGQMVVTQEYNAVTSKDSEKALGGLERQINGLQKKLESLLSNELSRIQKALSNENIDADGLNALSDRLGVIQDISVDFGFEKQRDSALDLIDAVNDVYDRIEVNPNQNPISLGTQEDISSADKLGNELRETGQQGEKAAEQIKVGYTEVLEILSQIIDLADRLNNSPKHLIDLEKNGQFLSFANKYMSNGRDLDEYQIKANVKSAYGIYTKAQTKLSKGEVDQSYVDNAYTTFVKIIVDNFLHSIRNAKFEPSYIRSLLSDVLPNKMNSFIEEYINQFSSFKTRNDEYHKELYKKYGTDPDETLKGLKQKLSSFGTGLHKEVVEDEIFEDEEIDDARRINDILSETVLTSNNLSNVLEQVCNVLGIEIPQAAQTAQDSINHISNENNLSSDTNRITEQARAEMQAEEAAYDARVKAEAAAKREMESEEAAYDASVRAKVEAERAGEAIVESQDRVQKELLDTVSILEELNKLVSPTKIASSKNIQGFNDSLSGLFGDNKSFEKTLRSLKEWLKTFNEVKKNGSRTIGNYGAISGITDAQFIENQNSIAQKLGYNIKWNTDNQGYLHGIVSESKNVVKSLDEVFERIFNINELVAKSNETPVSTDDGYVENHIEKLKQEEHQANETAKAENDLQQSRQGSLDSQLSNIGNIDELNNYIKTIDIAKSSAEELQDIVSKSQSIGGYWDLDPDALMGIVNRFEELGYALDDTGQNFVKVSQGIQNETNELQEEAQQAHVTAEAEHEVAEARQELVSPVNDVAEEPIIEGQNQIQAEFEETSEAGVTALTTIRQEAINTEQMLRSLFNQLFGLTAEQSIMRGLNSQDIIDIPDSQVKITDINNEATARQRNAEATREETKAQQEYNQAQQTHVNYGDYAETKNLSNLLSLVIAITQAVREKTEAFAQEDLLVSQAINNENGELSLLLQTLQQIKSIVKEIKIPNGGKLGWLKELSNADADKLSSVSENLKKIYDGVKKLDVKDSNFISQINTILNKGKELENLAKVLSSTKKDINDTAKATKSNKQTESKKTYDAELVNRKKILDLEYKIAKAKAEGDDGDLAEKRYRPEIDALERIVDAEKKKRQEQKLTSREYRSNIEHELSVIKQKQNAEIEGIRAVTAERNRQAQQQSLVGNIDQQLKDLEKARKSIDDLLNQKQSGLHPNYVQDAKDKIKELEEQIKKLQKMRVEIVDAKDLSELEEAQKLTEDLVDGAKKVKASATDSANKLAKDIKIQNLNEEITDFLTKNTKLSAEFRAELDALRKKLSGDNLSNQDILDIASAFAKVKASAKEAGDVGKSQLDSLKQRLADMNTKFLARFFSLQDIIRYGRTIVSTIQDLDYALVDLRKTTTMSVSELNEFYYSANDVAVRLGQTTKEIINQAAAWSRLGYSSKEAATQMAELSSQFAAISPGMSLDNATDGLVSTMKGFGIAVEDTERTILDNVNRIGNTFATSNSEIMEMLKRSSAAMNEANNTLEQTIALESAAVQVTRNAETTGTAFRTISMRIRGYDEETEEFIGNVEELTGKIANLTKTASKPGGISLFEDDAKTKYKSTYQLLKDISEIYNELTDKQQAGLLEALAGKRGGQVLAGILSPEKFKEVERAMQEMSTAAGAADAEMSIVEESIQFKLNALQQTWVGIAQELIDRGTIGDIIDMLTKISEGIANITENANTLKLALGAIIGVASSFKGVGRRIVRPIQSNMPTRKEPLSIDSFKLAMA